MRIGILGAGMIGETLGTLWHKAGHEVFFATRHPEALSELIARLGSGAAAGTVEEAVRFGPVVLWAVPLSATPALGQALGVQLAGKIVLDATNPYPSRDGDAAREVTAGGRGTGVWTARHLPQARVVRAFNTVYFKTMQSEAHRAGDRVGIPLAADDAHALQVAEQLVADAGFTGVRVGDLASAQWFEPGTPVYNTGMGARALRQALGL